MSVSTETSKSTKTSGTKATGSKATVTVSTPAIADSRKPFYAYVGLADLAVETAKTLPSVVPAEIAKLQEQVKSLPATLPGQVQAQVKALPNTLPNVVLTLPATVKSLQDKGLEFYGELATRGEKVVTAIRNQPSTELVSKAATATLRNAKATAKSASKTFRATEAAVEDAAEKIG